MKLLHCRYCNDIVALRMEPRACECGAASGAYIDQANVEVKGPARVLGLSNLDLDRGAPEIKCWTIRDSRRVRRGE